MRIARFSSMAGFLIFALAVLPLLAQTPPANPALGLVAKSVSGHIGDAAASEGATVFSGDYLSTEDAGSMLIRVGPLSLELQGSSAVHIYRAPYGAIVELNRGTVVYTTPGTQENIVIVASDVRVTPVLSLADLGRVSMDDPCEITVYSQRGRVNVQVGSESHLIEEAKAYRVHAVNEISYREISFSRCQGLPPTITSIALARPSRWRKGSLPSLRAKTISCILPPALPL